MIRYRIQQCRENGEPEPELFPSLSLRAIYFLSKGYPRKIVMLCSKILLAMLVKEKEKSTLTLVWNCAGETSISRFPGTRRGLYGTALLVFLIFGVLLLSDGGSLIKSVKERVLPLKEPSHQTQSTQPISGVSTSPRGGEGGAGHEAFRCFDSAVGPRPGRGNSRAAKGVRL